MKEPDPIFTNLFIDLQKMHRYLQMACEKEKDEIRQKHEPDCLLEEGEKLIDKWCYYIGRQAAKYAIASLNKDDNGK